MDLKKKGSSWVCADKELAKYFNIQSSRFSNRIYLNLGIYFQTVKEVNFPREVDCHLRFRIEQLLDSKDEVKDFYELSDFESGLDIESKIKKIANVVINKAMPFFNLHNSVNDILHSEQIKPHMYWNNGKDIATKLCSK